MSSNCPASRRRLQSADGHPAVRPCAVRRLRSPGRFRRSSAWTTRPIEGNYYQPGRSSEAFDSVTILSCSMTGSFTIAGVFAPLRWIYLPLLEVEFCAWAAGTKATIISIASPKSAAIRKQVIALVLLIIFPSLTRIFARYDIASILTKTSASASLKVRYTLLFVAEREKVPPYF